MWLQHRLQPHQQREPAVHQRRCEAFEHTRLSKYQYRNAPIHGTKRYALILQAIQ